jgi:hypothetical protein
MHFCAAASAAGQKSVEIIIENKFVAAKIQNLHLPPSESPHKPGSLHARTVLDQNGR